MGHERIGHLPRSVSWRNIVSALDGAASGSDTDIATLAAKTLELVRSRFQALHRDTGVQAAFGFIVALARSQPATIDSRAAPQLSLPSDATPFRLSVALNDWVDSHAESHEYAELSKRAAAEALAAWHKQQSHQPGLFAHGSAESSREVWSAASTGAGFSEVSRLFLARFTERYLRYFLEREASSAITSIDARERFSERLHKSVDLVSQHAFETSRIAQSFAAGWYNKHARHQTPNNASLSNFLRVAFEKLREELRRKALPVKSRQKHFLFCCNGAPARRREAQILEYRPEKSNRNIVAGLPKFVQNVIHLPARTLDLLEIATYVFAGDRDASRGRLDEVEYHTWSRVLDFHIRVRDLDFWNRRDVHDALTDAIEFMSGDVRVSFTFSPGHDTPPTSLFDRPEFRLHETGLPRAISLFSGGLDSLAGALDLAPVSGLRVQICRVAGIHSGFAG